MLQANGKFTGASFINPDYQSLKKEVNMYTGGYDIALQIKEEVFNKALAALYYKGLFYIKKVFKFHSDELPPTLTNFAGVTCKAKLTSPPLLDFVAEDTANLILNTQMIFYLLGSVEIEFDADIDAQTKIVYDNAHHKLSLDLKEAEITSISLNDDFDLDEASLKRINDVIKYIVQHELLHQMETVSIPLSIFDLKVPGVPETHQMPVNRVDGKIIDNSWFRAGIDLFEDTAGDFNAIQFNRTADYNMAITESTIQQVIDFWWLFTIKPHYITKSKTDQLDKVQNFVNDVIDVAERVLQVATLGAIDVDTTFCNTKMNYGATINFVKPNINILTGERFSIFDTQMGVDVWLNIKTDITTTTEVLWGLLGKSSTSAIDQTLVNVTDNIAVTLKNIEGRIYLNDQMEVMGEVEQIDVDFDFGDSFVENLTDAAVAIVKGWIIDMIKSHIHAIVLCPKVVDINIESLGYHALIAPEELITTDNEVRIALNLDIKELQKNTTPQPGFIANTHTKEVHRIYCDELDEMNEINKVGYFVLKDALNDGYDTCGKCIPWYSKR
ncbi:hypothetical protein [Paludibacter jiangxiensis]|nr:hypothetical protein [Paludibacter jiangxiensis]